MAEVEHCIRRNFDQHGSNAQWDIFKNEMKGHNVVSIPSMGWVGKTSCVHLAIEHVCKDVIKAQRN